MSADANKEVVRRFLGDLWAGTDAAGLKRYLHADYRGDGNRDLADAVRDIAGSREMAPDVRWAILDLVAEGDLVVAHWRSHGTDTGGAQPFGPSGRRVALAGATLYRMREGKVVEIVADYSNAYDVLVDHGVIPTGDQLIAEAGSSAKPSKGASGCSVIPLVSAVAVALVLVKRLLSLF